MRERCAAHLRGLFPEEPVCTGCTVRSIFKAYTLSGTIAVTNMTVALGGSVLTETDSGDISVDLSVCCCAHVKLQLSWLLVCVRVQRFAGLVSIVSGGPITVQGAGFEVVSQGVAYCALLVRCYSRVRSCPGSLR